MIKIDESQKFREVILILKIDDFLLFFHFYDILTLSTHAMHPIQRALESPDLEEYFQYQTQCEKKLERYFFKIQKLLISFFKIVKKMLKPFCVELVARQFFNNISTIF